MDSRISLRKEKLEETFFEKRKLSRKLNNISLEIDPLKLSLNSEVIKYFSTLNIEV